MNYFAHGYRFVADPYYLAGTALPDMLGVVDRRLRIRGRHARPHVTHAEADHAAVARGLLQHFADDDWFHATPAFTETSWQLTVIVRDALAEDDEGFRPSFLGHILVEMLLDAVLIEEMPERLERYYEAVAQIDPARLEEVVNRIGPRSTDRLARLLPLFVEERFLSDYADDAKLLARLNQVMRRVRLPPLPATFTACLPEARQMIYAARGELLARDADRGSGEAAKVDRVNVGARTRSSHRGETSR